MTEVQKLIIHKPLEQGSGNLEILARDEEGNIVKTQIPPVQEQNNTGKSIYVGEFDSNTNAGFWLVNHINNNLSFSVSATETPVILFAFAYTDNLITAEHSFLFLGGKGDWGLNGNTVWYSHLWELPIKNVTIQDIEGQPNTVINDLGIVPDGEFVPVANEAGEWQFTNPQNKYIFSYTTDGVLYMQLFIGEYGIYNGNFQPSDFISLTNSNVPPTPVVPTKTSDLENDGDGDSPFATLDDINQSIINVKDFGATGDGVTDDYDSIIAAFTAAKLSNINKVYFPSGVYIITKTLYVSSNIEYYGDGIGVTVIKNDSNAQLDLITPFNEILPANVNICKWYTMLATDSADEDTGISETIGITIKDMTFDWNSIECGVNSACAILIGRSKYSIIDKVEILDVLPSDLENTNNRRYGNNILFAFSEDCTIKNSKINASDYESLSVWFLSKRIKVYNNMFVGDKPSTFRNQAHCMQVARPSPASAGLISQFNEDRVQDVFIENNIFLLKNNIGHGCTSHSNNGFYFKNNYVKVFDTLTMGVFAVKPFGGTNDVIIDNNIFEIDNHDYQQYGSCLAAIGTSIIEPAIMKNISISNNKINVSKKSISAGVITYPDSSLIGGYLTEAENVNISNNNIYIDGYDNTQYSIIGATGKGINVNNNTINLKTPLETVNQTGVIFFRTKGGSNISITDNIVYDLISRGIYIENTAIGLLNFQEHDNNIETEGSKFTNLSPSTSVIHGVKTVSQKKADENGNIPLSLADLGGLPINASEVIIGTGTGTELRKLLPKDFSPSAANIHRLLSFNGQNQTWGMYTPSSLPSNSTLAQRTPTGTLKAQEAVEDDDLVILEQLNALSIIDNDLNTLQDNASLNAIYGENKAKTVVYAPNVDTGMVYIKLSDTNNGNWLAQTATSLT